MALLAKGIESLLDAVLYHDGLIGDGVGCWSWFDEIINRTNNIDIGSCNNVDLIGDND